MRQPAVAPWVRTRLRTAPGAAWALALLVALTSCLAAAFPRAVEDYEDAGLRHAVSEAAPERTVLDLTMAEPGLTLLPGKRDEMVRGASTKAAYRRVVRSLSAPLAVDAAQSSYGLRTTKALTAADPWLPRPDGLPAALTLSAQSGLAGHATVVRGRLPRVDGQVTADSRQVEAAVTAATARALHIEPGALIHVPALMSGRVSLRVTGIVKPRDPEGAYWAARPVFRTPALGQTVDMPPSTFWRAGLLLAPDAAPVLLNTDSAPEQFWQLAPDLGALNARGMPRLKSALTYTTDGPGLIKVRETTGGDTDAATGLEELITGYQKLRAGIGPVVSVAAYGTGTVAVIVLLMAGGLAAERRRPELTVLRSRGGSVRGLAGRLLAETAVVAVPAGAAGLAVALFAVPHGRWLPAALGAAAVVVLSCLALPVRAALAHRGVQVRGARDDLARARPSRRRTVAELTVLVLAVAAVVALRRRGTGDGGDSLVALAPVLVGVVAAFVLVRVYPLPLRWLARPAGRLRGAVGYLSLARAGRATAGAGTAVLPLLALLTALTTAAFGGSVLAGIDDARDRAATLSTGADARIESSSPLPSALAGKVARLPGVREVSPLTVRYDAEPGQGTRRIPLAVVDPASYARLSARTGLGPFPAHELTTTTARAGTPGSPLPVLASPSMRDVFGTGPFSLWLDGETVVLRISAVRAYTPALSQDFLVADAKALARRVGAHDKGSEAIADRYRPNSLLVTGARVDGAALRETAGSGVSVRLRATERARYVDSPLQTGAARVYSAAVVIGAGYAALSLLLALARAAPERGALLARLRTMGLTRRQARRLLVLEALPQAVLAAAGGALTGWAAIQLLAPGLDLTALALATGPGGDSPAGRLRTDSLSLLLPALCVVALATAVASGQAWWSGRRGSVRELRAGESL
ncbi:FtsX-like permease family protein [Streptomyces antnestii]|uniref:FtsX-like permease family protein n=1 Tax=Streptomyces antnestii TaxID=2494256 RepID=A0A3S2VHT1_9ACTN|nr:FtsX-like permease family protein [Streptomyces sp. San01]RVU24282.1 FtsX-like permease family protein [Streptomyces sp. San01]